MAHPYLRSNDLPDDGAIPDPQNLAIRYGAFFAAAFCVCLALLAL